VLLPLLLIAAIGISPHRNILKTMHGVLHQCRVASVSGLEYSP
jgi:hypothetical protein